MDDVLYAVIEYGIDPCILKLVCKDWKDSIDNIDYQIEQSLLRRFSDKTNEHIILMILDSGGSIELKKYILYMSKPIVNWNIISYLIEDKQIGQILYSRVKNSHTKEMVRRLGIPTSLPEKEIYKISSIIRGQTSTTSLMSLSTIISNGQLDAIQHLFQITKDNEDLINESQLGYLISTAISMLKEGEKLFNPSIISWLCKHKQYVQYVPDEIIQLTYIYEHQDHIYRISCDIPHQRYRMVPTIYFHQCGKKILTEMSKIILICKSYLSAIADKKLVPNIRVLSSILLNCNNEKVKEKAIEIIQQNGWQKYIL